MSVFLVPLNQGFAVRYFAQTDILSALVAAGHRVVVLVPDPEDPFFAALAAMPGVVLAQYQEESCAAYEAKSWLLRWLKHCRQFILNGAGDRTTVEGHLQVYLEDNAAACRTLRGVVRIGLVLAFVRLCCWSGWLRRSVRALEQRWYAPPIHEAVFAAHRPDLVVALSLGTFDWDQCVMREARRRGIPVVSLVMSWDNTTTRGMAGAEPDHVITWTEVMKAECRELNDIPADRITVGGVAHYDHYVREETFLPREKFCARLGLSPEKKTLFFATKSPNCYPHNHEIAALLMEILEAEGLGDEWQVLVRLHPLYYRKGQEGYLFQGFLDRFTELQARWPGLVINRPVIAEACINYAMPPEEIVLLASILRHSDLCVNMFSSLNIEASIFDIPSVNVCFEGKEYDGPMKARYNIRLDEAESHNQRIVHSGAVTLAYSPAELRVLVTEAARKPQGRAAARRALVAAEAGPRLGHAGRHIAEQLMRLAVEEH